MELQNIEQQSRVLEKFVTTEIDRQAKMEDCLSGTEAAVLKDEA